ncbi:unnamed protein product, partial [Callosobruchus maculatus]
MGRPNIRKYKKMSEAVTERRKSSDILKRSKSVRASLKLIGHKIMHHKNMQKTPSMTNLHEFKRSLSCGEEPTTNTLSILPEFYARQAVETILKTPIPEPKLKQKKEKVKLSTPPTLVAPKAAQVLQIPPVKEKSDTVTLVESERTLSEFSGSRTTTNVEVRTGGFHRSSLRLSLVASRRKNVRRLTSTDFPKLPALPGDLEMEVATNVALARGLPPAPQVKPPTKKEAKLLQQRLEKFARLNTHLPALFDAVQHGHMEKARTILESTDVDVNR